jgi:hypothetical protein
MAVIEAIATTYLEADAATVTFSSLGSYEHLQLRFSVRTVRASDLETVGIRFNSDTGSNYATCRMYVTATSVAAGPEASTDRAYAAGQQPTASMSPRTVYGTSIVDIFDYRNANKNTTVMFHSAEVGCTGSGDTPYDTFGGGLWDSTAAVTSLLLYPANGSAGFARGSEFTLYGLNSS